MLAKCAELGVTDAVEPWMARYVLKWPPAGGK
jgi:hypothetical protein